MSSLNLIEIKCLEPEAPLNGTVILSTLQFNVGTTAIYSCDPGYVLVGETTRTCEDTNGGTVITGTWSGTPPYCQGVIKINVSVINSCQV